MRFQYKSFEIAVVKRFLQNHPLMERRTLAPDLDLESSAKWSAGKIQ